MFKCPNMFEKHVCILCTFIICKLNYFNFRGEDAQIWLKSVGGAHIGPSSGGEGGTQIWLL